ncbi:MAG: RNA-binding domain-containing protein [Bacillota bacterium]
MKSNSEIIALINNLDNCIADDLESQDLDFKEWNERSINDSVNLVVKMAVCMANGGGGTVVFGIRDRVKGKANAIVGVPSIVDISTLQKTVYDRTEPHITPVFEWFDFNEYSARVILMKVFPGMPPYTESNGAATIRIGKECVPLTGTLRRQMLEVSGTSDFTSNTLDVPWKDVVSPIAMERIRTMMSQERAPETLYNMSDEDLLSSIGAIKNGNLTFGGLLIVGNNEAIAKYVPSHLWSFRKMLSTTEYAIKDDGNHAIPLALHEIERYMAAENPTTTIEVGFLHPEYSVYPKIALREALLNAFVHRDYRMPGAVMLKSYPDKMILTNAGNFIGGITPDNILHHPPVARNGHLVDLLDKLRLVNRSNLGVPRIYKSLLVEGKEPPQYREIGDTVELTIMASSIVPSFRQAIKDLNDKGISIDVDHLIVLNYLIRHREIDTFITSKICQRSIDQARELLTYMENNLQLLQSGGQSKGKYYTLSRLLYDAIEKNASYDRDRRLDKEAMKVRILSILKERNLTNAEIRQITELDRQQVLRLMRELEQNNVKISGTGRAAYYYLEKNES